MKVDVIIMAGAKNTGALRECSQSDYEALIAIRGVPMIDYVVESARQAKSVGRIAVVGPVAELQPHLADKVEMVVEGKEKLLENIQLGIQALKPERKVLILCSDIPLISPEAIDEFVSQCVGREVDVYYPIISKEANLERFPGTHRTYARLREGTYTGGNMFIINPVVIDGAMEFANKMITWRKKPLKMSQAFGVIFIVKFVLGCLSIAELERRVQKITGFSAAAVIVRHPEIGFDVDKPSDLEMMEKYIG